MKQEVCVTLFLCLISTLTLAAESPVARHLCAFQLWPKNMGSSASIQKAPFILNTKLQLVFTHAVQLTLGSVCHL